MRLDHEINGQLVKSLGSPLLSLTYSVFSAWCLLWRWGVHSRSQQGREFTRSCMCVCVSHVLHWLGQVGAWSPRRSQRFDSSSQPFERQWNFLEKLRSKPIPTKTHLRLFMEGVPLTRIWGAPLGGGGMKLLLPHGVEELKTQPPSLTGSIPAKLVKPGCLHRRRQRHLNVSLLGTFEHGRSGRNSVEWQPDREKHFRQLNYAKWHGRFSHSHGSQIRSTHSHRARVPPLLHQLDNKPRVRFLSGEGRPKTTILEENVILG